MAELNVAMAGIQIVYFVLNSIDVKRELKKTRLWLEDAAGKCDLLAIKLHRIFYAHRRGLVGNELSLFDYLQSALTYTVAAKT